MLTWHEKTIKLVKNAGGKGLINAEALKANIVKSKSTFCLCAKCEMKIIHAGHATAPYCFLCSAKMQKQWNEAKDLITHGFCGTGWYYSKEPSPKEGWGFASKVLASKLFLAILKHTTLNKTPKTGIELTDMYSAWQIKTAEKYFGGY